MSTITAAYVAWFVLFHRDKNVLILATKQETAKNMIRSIKTVFKYIPKWILDIAKIKVDNRNSVEFENGSRVKAITTSADAGRSESVSLLIIDEAAHIENFEEIWTGTAPTISTGGSVIIMSSPNGTGNIFHKLFEGARNNENGFNTKYGHYVNPDNPLEMTDEKFPWWVHPEHNLTWFKAETGDKSPREINQEFLAEFNASGDTFIYHEDIGRLERQCVPHMNRYEFDKNFWMWKGPESNGAYLITSDVSRGDAEDYSAFHVIRLDVSPIEQVAEYKGKIRPDKLGLLLMDVSKMYNNATVAPENNSGWSGQAILKMEEAQFPFIYYSRRRKSKDKDTTLVDPYYAMYRNDYLPGYSITSANRLPMLAKLEQYVRTHDIKINSSRTVEELKTFVMKEGGRPEALRGYNDDLVMSLAAGIWIREEAFLFSYKSDEMTKAMIASMSTEEASIKNVRGFSSDFSARGIIQEHVAEQNKIIMADGREENLDWLYDSPIGKG
jgi:hypothetical protein